MVLAVKTAEPGKETGCQSGTISSRHDNRLTNIGRKKATVMYLKILYPKQYFFVVSTYTFE